MFGWSDTLRPIVALAPMAGVTDASYRQFIKMVAPETIVYTEFLSTDAMHFGALRPGSGQAAKTLKMLEFDPLIEKPFIVQIFGNNREHFITSCKVIEQIGADGIDINMGCPAARIVSSCHGSALIRRPELAADLVHAAVSAVKIPVSVKTRLGWEDASSLIPFCQKLEEAGAACFAIHGRSYKQKFTGAANWEPIYELKNNVSVPVLGNGDVDTSEDAFRLLKSLDGVMVGRGTMGDPRLLREIRESFTQSAQSTIPATLQDKVPFILKHCELAVRWKGEKRGIVEMRRHFAGYVKGFDGAKEMRMRLMGAESMSDVIKVLTVF